MDFDPRRRRFLAGLNEWALGAAAAAMGAPSLCPSARAATELHLLNVSYDTTAELYGEFNPAFEQYWQARTGQRVRIDQSHGPSGLQTQAVTQGLQGDVVTLALSGDIDTLAAGGRILPRNWRSRLPEDSVPYTSTIVFLVRAGNPKGISDWGDLVEPGVAVVTSSPKHSGGGRWSYLAAWAWALRQPGASARTARAFVERLYRGAASLDPGSRGSTMTFVGRGVGDVLVGWENEARLAIRALGTAQFEIVLPSVSMLAQPCAAWVDEVVERRGTLDVARAYLEYLYSKTGQDIIARHDLRPRDPEIADRYADRFADLPLVTVAEFGGWAHAERVHFARGGIFDQITGAAPAKGG